MNGFQSFVDHMLKITETYQLNELYLSGGLKKLGTLTKHLLRALQRFDTDGGKYSNDAVGEIKEKWLPQLNNELGEIPWKSEITKKRIFSEWTSNIKDALRDYESSYNEDQRLFPITGVHSIKLKRKILDDAVIFEDLGLILDVGNKKRVQFTFSFEEALRRNS